jgi:hypothetical protein
MILESMVAVRAGRHAGLSVGGFVAWAAVATLSLAPAAANAADPGKSGPVGKSPVVTFESIPGSPAKRIILTQRAAERLGIETGKVSEEAIVSKQMVGGLVIPPIPPSELLAQRQPAGGTFGGFGRGAAVPAPKPASSPIGGLGGDGDLPAPETVTAPVKASANGEVWVLVTLSPAEWERLAKDKPARLLPLATRENSQNGHGVLALPLGIPPQEDIKRSMLNLYYKVPGKNHGLTVQQRMRVELQLPGNEAKQKVVPYGAVYYDGKGAAWVYLNPQPLVFERQRIKVERVVGDLAVLAEGPPVGTPVVTVGAALLYGTEIFGK